MGKALFLSTPSKTYAFNCTEGTCRLYDEYSAASKPGSARHVNNRAFGRLSKVLLTRNSWECHGGLASLCFASRYAGSSGFDLYGPKGSYEIFYMAKDFIHLNNFTVTDLTSDSDGTVTEDDSSVIIKAVRLTSDSLVPAPAILSDTFQYKSMHDIVEWTEEKYVFAYHIGLQGETGDETSALVIDCPDESYFSSLLNNKELKFMKQRDMKIVFHFTPVEVAENSQYLKWIQSAFSEGTYHVFLRLTSNNVSSRERLIYHKQLQLIAPDLFREKQTFESNPEIDFKDLNAHPGSNSSVIQISPDFKIEDRHNTKHDEKYILKDPREREHIKYLEGTVPPPDLSKPAYPKITFLGTGSTRGSVFRNVSGILVETTSDHFMLLDAGEDTLGQLYEMYGQGRAQEILTKLNAIFISHRHPDHHLGLITVLQKRTESFKKADLPESTLFLISGHRVNNFYRHYHYEAESLMEHVKVVHPDRLLVLKSSVGGIAKPQIIDAPLLNEVLKACSLSYLESCYARHCPQSFCISLTNQDNFKLVYTGDTKPCPNLDFLAGHRKSPDIFIHESTFENFRTDDAMKKQHSTTKDAITNGRNSGAGFTILTHFQVRYPKIPNIFEVEGHERVGVAFDFMTVSPQTLHQLPYMLQSLKVVFSDEMKYISKVESRYNLEYGRNDSNSKTTFHKINVLDSHMPRAGMEKKPIGHVKLNLAKILSDHEPVKHRGIDELLEERGLSQEKIPKGTKSKKKSSSIVIRQLNDLKIINNKNSYRIKK